jgi:hypothetical protein
MRNKEYIAWIEVDGVKLTELAVMQIGSIVECFIESFPGKVCPISNCNHTLNLLTVGPIFTSQNFSVHWACDSDGLFSSGYIFIDGTPYPGRFLNGKATTNRAGARTGAMSERPFTFTETTKKNGKYSSPSFP